MMNTASIFRTCSLIAIRGIAAAMLMALVIPAVAQSDGVPAGNRTRLHDIEQTLREFNARYNMMARYNQDADSDSTNDQYDGDVEEYYKNAWVRWPARLPGCVSCGGHSGTSPAPPKPENGFYGRDIEDDQFAVELVAALEAAFYATHADLGSTTLYSKFIDEEKALTTSPSTGTAYVAGDFPKKATDGGWEATSGEGITRDNFKTAYRVLKQYIGMLNATGTRGSGDIIDTFARTAYESYTDNTQSMSAEEIADAMRVLAKSGWDSGVGWQSTTPGYAVAASWLTVTAQSGGAIEYTATRGKIEIDLTSHTEGAAQIYLKTYLVNSYATAESGDVDGAQPPVEVDSEWHAWRTVPVAQVYTSEYLIDDELHLPGGTASSQQRGWFLDDADVRYLLRDTPAFDTSPDSSCGPDGCSGSCTNGGGHSCAVSENGADISLPTGPYGHGDSSGRLSARFPEPSADVGKPSTLRWDVAEELDDADDAEPHHVILATGDDNLRQLMVGSWTNATTYDVENLIEVVDTSPTDGKYEIKYYREATWDNTNKDWDPTVSTHYRTVTIEDTSSGGDGTKFRVKTNESGVDRISDFEWGATDDYWTLEDGVNSGTGDALRQTSRSEVATAGSSTVTHVVADGSGNTKSKRELVYEDFNGMRRLVSITDDPDGAKLTQTFEYVADGDGYGQLRLYVSERGSWEHHEYDSAGRKTRTIRQLGANEYAAGDLDALAADNLATIYTYLDADLADAGTDNEHVIRMQVKAEDTLVRTSYRIKWSETTTIDSLDCYEEWSVTSALVDPQAGHASTTVFLNALYNGTDTNDNHVTKTWKIAAKDSLGGDQDDAYETKKVERPDGQITLYDHSTPGTTVVERGYPNGAGTAILYGTRTTSVVDDKGQFVSSLTERIDPDAPGSAGNYFVVSLTKATATDAFGRTLTTSYYFGEEAKDENTTSGTGTAAYTTSRTYTCCGTGTVTDRAGLVTHYDYDDLFRRDEVKRTGGKTETGSTAEIIVYTTFDAAGRVTQTERDGSDASSMVLSKTTYDTAGRTTVSEDGNGHKMFYTYRRVKADGSAYTYGTDTGPFYWEDRVYPHNKAAGPVRVTWADSHGRTVLSMTGTVATDWSGSAPGSVADLSEVFTRTETDHDWAGRVTASRSYFDFGTLAIADLRKLATPGSAVEGTHYYDLSGGPGVYDALGRMIRSTDVMGNITATVYAPAGSGGETGRPIETWVGTDATGATAAAPGPGTGTNNMVKVSEAWYDLDQDRDDAETDFRPFVTRSAQLKPLTTLAGTAADYITSDYERVYTVSGGALVSTANWDKPAANGSGGGTPWSKQVSDEQGRGAESLVYKNGSTTYILAKNTTHFNTTPGSSFGRVQSTRVHETNGSGGTTGSYLETSYEYDFAGRQVKTSSSGGGFSKTAFDAHGRTARMVTGSAEGVTTDVDGSDVFDDDIILTEVVYTYDDADQTIQTAQYDRNHDTAGTTTGLLSASAGSARIAYSAAWRDESGRVTHAANYGTNGGAAFTRPGTAPEPNSSDDVLVTKSAYGTDGRLDVVTDNKAIQRKFFYDDLGRTTHVVENYVPGSLTNGDPDTPASRAADVNRITKTVYNAASQTIQQIAIDPDHDGNTSEAGSGGNQVTTYVYSDELNDKGGPVKSNSLRRAIIMPDSDDVVASNALGNGTDSTYDRIEFTYLADGSGATRKDQRGVTLTSHYHDNGIRKAQVASNFDADTDDAVKSITYAYDDLLRPDTVSSHSSAQTAPTATDVVNEVTYHYNGLGQRTKEYQDHDGVVDDDGVGGNDSHHVAYAYDTTAAANVFTKAHRTKTMTFPNGRVVHSTYDGHGGIDDAISRPNALAADNSGTPGTPGDDIVAYTRMGSGATVIKDLPTPDIKLDYFGGTPGTYGGFDRFNRVVAQQWIDYSGTSDADVVHVQHGYDRNSNRLHDDRQVYKSYAAHYTHDSLDRLTGFAQGKIKSDQSGIEDYWKMRHQDWTLSQTGNQLAVGEFGQTTWRSDSFNKANEFSSTTGSHKVRADAGPDEAPLEDLFGDPNTAGNYTAPGTGDTFSVSNGVLKITAVSNDTIDDEPVALVVIGEDIGVNQLMTRFKFPASTTTGYAGIIFGYKSANDYWMSVHDIGAQKQYLYHVIDGDKGTAVAELATTIAADAWHLVIPHLDRGASQRYLHTFAGGAPSGAVGLVSTVVNTEFDYLQVPSDDRVADTAGRLANNGAFNTEVASYSGSDRLSLSGLWSAQFRPTLFRGVRAEAFRATFSAIKSQSNNTTFRFVFNAKDNDDYHFLVVHLRESTGTQFAPVGYTIDEGAALSTVSSTRTDTNMPFVDQDELVWLRVESDGTDLTVKAIKAASAPSESQWSATAACFTSSAFGLDGGEVGLALGAWVYIDDLTLKAHRDTTGNGTPDTWVTEHVDHFTTSGGGADDAEPTHDAAGNLTYDGIYAYEYDAWNRQVKTTKAYRDPGSGNVTEGRVVQEVEYDALNRRIVKRVQNSADLDCTYHSYHDSHSMVEERDGSDNVLRQNVWAGPSGGYIDELIQTSLNADPDDVTEDDCETDYFALHNTHYNVMALVDDTGELVERYEYTPYGQRTVYTTAGTNDPLAQSPITMSDGFEVSSTDQPYGLNPFGHQGLHHDEETTNIHNRDRVLLTRLMRYAQRDRIGYPDGMNGYAYYAGMHGAADPTGTNLVPAGRHHLYPLYLGGNNDQPLFPLSASRHSKAHDYLIAKGFTWNDEGRANWKALSASPQEEHIRKSLRAARIPQKWIDQNIKSITKGANPGKKTVRIPNGFGNPGARGLQHPGR